jgi:hypothetical protein
MKDKTIIYVNHIYKLDVMMYSEHGVRLNKRKDSMDRKERSKYDFIRKRIR